MPKLQRLLEEDLFSGEELMSLKEETEDKQNDFFMTNKIIHSTLDEFV